MRNNKLGTNFFVYAKLTSEAGTAYKLIGCATTFSDDYSRSMDNVTCQGTGDVVEHTEGKLEISWSLGGFVGVPTSTENTNNKYAAFFEDGILATGGTRIDLKVVETLNAATPVSGDKVKELKDCKIEKHGNKNDVNAQSTYDVSGKCSTVVKTTIA